LNARKNLSTVISALLEHELISRDFPLIVVGALDGAQEALGSLLRDAIRAGTVVFAGFLPDAELKWLYVNSSALIFGSLDEGFGLPILEAHATGTRIAMSDIPAFRELAADGDVLFDPRDKSSIAGAVTAILSREHGEPPSDVSAPKWADVTKKSREAIMQGMEGTQGGPRI
jgi:glycosyltransferase involved in cell wall biosynthesis